MLKEHTTQFEILDILLSVSYYFQEGNNGSYFEPSEPDQVDILKVSLWLSEEDITDLLSDYVINTIKNDIINHQINKN
jgi:hypothetical protein